MESAIRQSSFISQHQQLSSPAIKEDPSNVYKMSESKTEKPCYRCSGNHKPDTCLFKDKECFYCKKKGYTIKVCRKRQNQSKNATHSTNQISSPAPFENKTDNNDDVFEIFQLKPNANLPLKVEIAVNSNPISMEVDTGDSTSLINYASFVKICGNNTRMNPTTSRIRTYTGEIIKPKGSVEVHLDYMGQKIRETIIIVDGNYSNLLGRDILRKIKLNWNELFKVNQVTEHFVDDIELNNILTKNVFERK